MEDEEQDVVDPVENPFTTQDEDNMFAEEFQGSHTA